MQITTDEIRGITERLLAHLDESGNGSISVEWDYYWNVPPEQRYDPYRQPDQLTIGQLSDDWAELLGILQNKKPPLAYALVWLSTILRAAGETVVS